MSLNSIMNLIDEEKQQIPDDLYLKLSNLLKEEHKKEEDTCKFYNITYLYSSPEQINQMTWCMVPCMGNEINKLSGSEYMQIKRDIEMNSFSYKLFGKLSQQNKETNYVKTHDCHYCQKCDECNGKFFTTLLSKCCIISIKPV